MAAEPLTLVAIGEFTGPDGVEVSVEHTAGGRRVHLRSTRALAGIASGRFSRPAASVPLTLVETPGDEPQLLGLAFTQFALPVVAGRDLAFDFRPAANLQSPPAMGLLLVRTGAHTTLLAPLAGTHEQVIAVDGPALRWGWHGDLDEVPAGFTATLGVYEGDSPTHVLAAWARERCGGTPTIRRRDHNPLTSHLSYWTDNGAAYWYRTEPGQTIATSVGNVVDDLRSRGVPVHAVELDSWFYRHETPRPIDEIGYPHEVPPTGMMEWLPRSDAFDAAPIRADGRDAIERWTAALGNPPLAFHARHISPASPYVTDDSEWWVDDLAAQPKDPAFFRRWFDDALRWGACCIEQDWMLMYWFGVRALRAAPGRALAWQRALARHAADTGIGLMWCMATPADMFEAATLDEVIAIRTSDDYRFAADPAFLWIWYLTVNRITGALGLPAFKDVFFTQAPPPGADPIDGDPHSELEALLACMSAGPVGIGDRIGHTDVDVVRRTCDDDGRIRHVDRPLALIDDCLFGGPARGERLAWATATATTSCGEVWTYVVAVNVTSGDLDEGDAPLADVLPLAEIGIDGPRSVLAWRRRTLTEADRLEVALARRDWALFVVAPSGRSADSGDLDRYVTVPSDLP